MVSSSPTHQQDDGANPVVASLPHRSPHPYSSIASSPSRRHAVVAGKDTLTILEVGPQGLSLVKSFRVSQHFQNTVPAAANSAKPSSDDKTYGDIRETFGLKARPTPNIRASGESTVNCTHVAWSLPQVPTEAVNDTEAALSSSIHTASSMRDSPSGPNQQADTLIAVSGSNGIVVIWNANRSILSSSNQNPMPEVVLTQHARAVNKLAWHPTGKRPELLLSASQDSTVKLWERSTNGKDAEESSALGLRSWFGMQLQPTQVADQSVSWQCKFTFQPHSEAVRDIAWSNFDDNVFAMVTGSGCLIVYNITAPARPWVKIAAHSGEATTLDWHPTRPFIVATGGGSQDQRVKIWDLESSMDLSKRDDKYGAKNSLSAWSEYSHASTVSDHSNDETIIRSGSVTPRGNSLQEIEINPVTLGSYGSGTRSLSSSTVSLNSTLTSNKFVATATRHVLSISASVTHLKWRPPSHHSQTISMDGSEAGRNRHDAMLAVATAPIKGAHAGGFGVLSLWSHHRPYMPLSVLEGHTIGAVTDFVWLDTPDPAEPGRSSPTPPGNASPFETESESSTHLKTTSGIWQHVLSVGRDGQCLLQSFARGDRPISRVPPSCFAIANLSPFQSGYGSLQICAVHQRVPSTRKDDFLLTGLRRDEATARAPGVFREVPFSENDDVNHHNSIQLVEGIRHPASPPMLVTNVIDDGELDENGMPISGVQAPFMVAPEVVHLSRFADAYKLYLDESCPTRVALCFHNGDVADRFCCGPLARMWRMLASILQGSGLTDLPARGATEHNAMEFVLLPTLRSLLEQRADAGDAQTCVALCEVMQVIQPQGTSQTKPGDADSAQDTRIPGIELNLVREWYLSYIDLLQQMCLFSQASNLIRNCNDSFIGALNQQSTTINESCPHCQKPLHSDGIQSVTRRTCRSCRRRVGMCFLCHEPVTGVFVWCPGCGHGGHLDHALQWFGGMSGKPVREMCPTGCGHKCNLVQQVRAFPKTASLLRSSQGARKRSDEPMATA